MESFDQACFLAVYGGPGAQAHLVWTSIMLALTFIGSGWVSLAVIPFFASTRTRPFAKAMSGVILTTCLLVFGLKALVRRPRPFIALAHVAPLCHAPHGFSFPSGHSAGSFCVATFFATWMILDDRLRPARLRSGARTARVYLGAASLVALAAAIGLSRVYLGVHFPGDVTAGALIGTLTGVFGAYRFAIAEARPEAAAGPIRVP